LETEKTVIVFADYLLFQFPSGKKEWPKNDNELEENWQFPNCLGAADGKRSQTIPPKGSGYFLWNYKGSNISILLARTNANKKSIYRDIGTNGRISVGGVIESTKFYEKLVGGHGSSAYLRGR
jgi:hypothetical protein